MDWFVNHVRLLDLMSARTETLHTSLLFIVTVGGERDVRVNVTL